MNFGRHHIKGVLLLLLLSSGLVAGARAGEADPVYADEPEVLAEEVLAWPGPPAYEALRGLAHDPDAFPTVAQPWPRSKRAAEYDALEQECRRLFALPPEEVEPHPSAVTFPGLPAPGAERVRRTLRYPLGKTEARTRKVILSTGLYAPPGEVVEISRNALLRGGVTTNSGSMDSGVRRVAAAGETGGQGNPGRLFARINLQHNNQNNPKEHPRDEVERMPVITQRVPLEGAVTRVASPFGGMIYLEAPATSGELAVTVSGGIPVPRFVLGQTDLGEWKEEIRHHPAPWAELRSKGVVLTLRSDRIRDLGDPTTILETWDRIIDAGAEFVGRPPERRWPPERIVFEALVWGAHSGYPMIVYQAREANALDFNIRWMTGMLHELGHNFQSPRWTEPATVEVTCNLVRFYTCDRVFGRTLDDPVFTWKRAAAKAEEYLAGDAPFNGRTPSQYMFLLLAEELGWEPYVEAFGALARQDEAEVPTETQAERALLVRELSLAAGRDLRPYFLDWRFIAASAPDPELDALPGWKPEKS